MYGEHREQFADRHPAITFIGGAFLIAVVILFLVNWGFGVSCIKTYKAYQPEYSFMAGCRIMWHGLPTPTAMVSNINY